MRFLECSTQDILFNCSSAVNNVLANSELCVQLLLASGHTRVTQYLNIRDGQTELVELYSRERIYSLRLKRVKLLYD